MTFLNVVEIESALGGLASAYPNTSRLITLPFLTAEGRECHALAIGTGAGCPRTGVLLISGAHAREWGGPDVLINLAADLLEAYALGTGLVYGGVSYTAAEIQAIVTRIDLIVFPDINPDGRQYSQTVYGMWRKNRNPASSGGAASKIGVDVNRNYDFLWDFPVAFAAAAQGYRTLASNDPASDLFHGTGPFSEPETRNVRWLFDQYRQINWFLDLHSYGGDILHPWGDDENQSTDTTKNFTNPAWNGKRGVPADTHSEFIVPCDLGRAVAAANAVKAAIAGVRGQAYAIGQSYWLPSWGAPYPTSGASDDWAFSRHYADGAKKQVNAFVIEFNRTKDFFPTWTEMEQIILDIDAGLVRLCLRALPLYPRPTFWCVLTRWWNEAIWHKVWPPELWGPYGPWGRLRLAVESVLLPIVRPFIRRARERDRG